MEGVELFFLTNNSMAEAVYYQGNYSDKDIFESMLRLVYLELMRLFKITHNLGSRDKANIGKNICFPRGCLTDGIDPPGFILDFGPLNETAFDISVSVLPWVRICIGVNNIKPLTHEGWFEEVHGSKVGKKNDDGI